MLVPVGAMLVLGLGGLPAVAAQRDQDDRQRTDRNDRRERRERGGRERVGQARPRDQEAGRDNRRREPVQEARAEQGRRGADDGRREGRDSRREGGDGWDRRQDSRRDNREWRGDSRRDRRHDRRPEWRHDSRDDRRPALRHDSRYHEPRRVHRSHHRRHYGSGGHLSIYFGSGLGYRYGSFYDGRVYGYAPPAAYGARRYYGDVRLLVRPRNAQVFVDGYYAGLVDDFDGLFQRLTLEVGPHQIEIDAPGFEPQVFDIYVDPTRTIDLRSDLYPAR